MPVADPRAVRLAVVAAVLAVAGGLALAPRASAAPGMEIAVQDDFALVTQSYGPGIRDKALNRAGEFRTRWVRANVLWAASNGRQARSRSKPRKVKYDFTAYDHLVVAARRRGMSVELTISGPAPAWATGNRKIGPYRPNAKHYGAFVKAVVRHFGINVNRYSIWNEPNHRGWLQPLKSAPSLYRSLYKAGYREVKRANRSAQVLIGETSPYATRGRSLAPVDFLRKLMSGGTRLTADGYAHHPYDLEHAPNHAYPGRSNATLGTLGNLVSELDRQASANRLRTPGGRALDLFLTEYGYLRAGRYRMPEDRRAQFLRQGWDMALGHPRVRQILQYLLVQPSKRYSFFDMSLLNRKGNPFGASFTALVNWSNQHQGEINGNVPSGGNNPPPPPPYRAPTLRAVRSGGEEIPRSCGLPICVP